MRPYIRITNFTDYEQVEQMLAVMKAANVESVRQLHVGVMMSYKTLYDLPTKWNGVFPPKENIAGIFKSDETMNCLHIADYESRPNVAMTLAHAISYGGIGINAIQLDMIWPDPGEIAHGVHMSRKNLEVVLQVGKNAVEQVHNNPDLLVERLSDYEGIIHRVLLDMSMGQGKSMDSSSLLSYARKIEAAFPNLGLVFAGGLCGETSELMVPIYEEFPDASCDGQWRLQQSEEAPSPLDMKKSGDHLEAQLYLAPT